MHYRIILVSFIAPLIIAGCKTINAPVNTVKYGVKVPINTVKIGVKAPIDAVDKETALGSVITGETKNIKGFLQKVKETNERHSRELERTRESDYIYEPHHGIDDR